MLRRMLVLIFLLSLFLAGCQSQTATPVAEYAVQETKALVTQSDPIGDASPVSPEPELPVPTGWNRLLPRPPEKKVQWLTAP